MQSTDDGTLLRQYAENHSDEAFAALVSRHVNLVYSVALRHVGNPHLAEEVAQAVFIILAKKAAQLRHDKALSSWLFQTTRLAASNIVRGETRRHRREQEAHMQSVLNESGSDVWPRIAPLLDDAVAELSETDRQAIVLRFYEGRSLRDVGAALGASEDATEKRVSRAVERLREFFAKRGVTVGASGLAVVISANAVQAAPVGLAITVSATALTGTAITTSTVIAATTKTIAMTTLQKTLVAATVAVLAGAGIYEARQATNARAKVQTLQQQQASTTDQIQQLQNNFMDATNQLADLLAENIRMKSNPERNELLKLRGQVGVLQQELAKTNAAGSQPKVFIPKPVTAAAHTPGEYIASSELAFVGYSTPEASMESTLWAITHGTFEQFIAGMKPDQAEGIIKNPTIKPAFENEQASIKKAYQGIQILAKKTLGADRVELKVRNFLNPINGMRFSANPPMPYSIHQMFKVADEWKFSGSPRPSADKDDDWNQNGEIQTYSP